MDFDLEIISEEGDRPDPLFDSIMNAMNSMKEATADKIYQKIQKEGATNYSKPQVDRALANALKYGIFEVRNNRYRVRDDILDDEDTVYWKLQKKRDQTPFRIQEETTEKQFGPKLNPEKDNKRFKKPETQESAQCPHCGRIKRPESRGDKSRHKKPARKAIKKRKQKKPNPRPYKSKQFTSKNKKQGELIKRRESVNDEETSPKRRKTTDLPENKGYIAAGSNYFNEEKLLSDFRKERMESQEGRSETSASEMELLNASENSLKSYPGNKKVNLLKRKSPRSAFSSECVKADLDVLRKNRSSISTKSESDSEKTFISSASDDQSQTLDSYFEDRPCTSQNDKVRNQYLDLNETYRNQYERDQPEKNKGNSEWMSCADEPQGTIIQSNNVLIIEPMGSLAFKNPEQASYIS